MPLFDLSLENLWRYAPDVEEPPALDAFWERAIAAAHARQTEPVFTPHHPRTYGALAVDDVSYSGADGHPVRGWFLRPRDAVGPLACLVHFVGYGGGRGAPSEHALYPAAGFACLVMDSRAQGGSWTTGATGDPGAGASGAEHSGVMTRGLLAPKELVVHPYSGHQLPTTHNDRRLRAGDARVMGRLASPIRGAR